jgi:signal transduction histidine kinase
MLSSSVAPGAAKPSLETYMSFVYPDDREVVRKHAENILKSHRYPGGYEVRIVRPDGKIRWIRLDGELVRNEAGEPVRLLGMMADITERKRAEEALKTAKMQAELYVDLMCHDISNMNQVGLGFLEMALDMLDLDEMGREMLLKPKSAFEGSTKLIDNVRKLKKAMSGEYLDREMDLGQVLGNVRDYYLKQHGSNISINYAMNIGYAVKANELLFDVFSNLIGNSIKHSRGPPIIGITIESVRENSIDYYKVAIDDHGPGILDELKATIFDRKLMGDTKSKGSGIGLLLVKTLVDSYKGRVWVEDRMPGDHTKGARFIVLLPAVDG